MKDPSNAMFVVVLFFAFADYLKQHLIIHGGQNPSNVILVEELFVKELTLKNICHGMGLRDSCVIFVGKDSL